MYCSYGSLHERFSHSQHLSVGMLGTPMPESTLPTTALHQGDSRSVCWIELRPLLCRATGIMLEVERSNPDTTVRLSRDLLQDKKYFASKFTCFLCGLSPKKHTGPLLRRSISFQVALDCASPWQRAIVSVAHLIVEIEVRGLALRHFGRFREVDFPHGPFDHQEARLHF